MDNRPKETWYSGFAYINYINMSTHDFFKPHSLERNSFLWSQARLIIAAVALLLGGVPVLKFVIPFGFLNGLVGLVLILAWLASGLASGYLLYRWIKGNKILFGTKRPRDTAAFLVSVISGLNLGIVALLGRNIGMSITTNYIIFVIVAVLYIATAIYLQRRWKQAGERVF